jgi:hypothetical protein
VAVRVAANGFSKNPDHRRKLLTDFGLRTPVGYRGGRELPNVAIYSGGAISASTIACIHRNGRDGQSVCDLHDTLMTISIVGDLVALKPTALPVSVR